MTKLLVTSQNFANAPKTEYLSHIKHTVSPFQVVQFNVLQDTLNYVFILLSFGMFCCIVMPPCTGFQ
jgi:hypothetical protein